MLHTPMDQFGDREAWILDMGRRVEQRLATVLLTTERWWWRQSVDNNSNNSSGWSLESSCWGVLLAAGSAGFAVGAIVTAAAIVALFM